MEFGAVMTTAGACAAGHLPQGRAEEVVKPRPSVRSVAADQLCRVSSATQSDLEDPVVGLFSKRPSTIVPADVLRQLGAFGQVSLEAKVSSRPVSDPRFDWDSFFSKAFPAFQTDLERAINDIHNASSGDELARFGGYRLIAEYEPKTLDPQYLDMMDAGLQIMHERGLSSGHLTRYEADRWIATHGDLRTSFDRIVEVAPPSAGHTAEVALDPGQDLLVATMGPNALDNQFWIERADDGSYGAYSMRQWESDAVILTRCSENSIGRWDTAEGILRSLGEYLRTPPFWFHEQLEPYFVEKRNL